MAQKVATRALVVFRADRCKSCGWCIEYCPKGNIRFGEAMNAKGKHPAEMIDEDACTGCGQCALVCPDICISVYRAERGD